MKNYLILFAALTIALAFSACTEDEEGSAIEGTWIATSETRTGCNDENGNGTIDYTLQSCSIDPDNCAEIAYTFRGDGTYTIVNTIIDSGVEFSLDDIVGTYTYDGTTLEVCDENGANCASGTFPISGNTATVDNGVDSLNGCASTLTLTKQ